MRLTLLPCAASIDFPRILNDEAPKAKRYTGSARTTKHARREHILTQPQHRYIVDSKAIHPQQDRNTVYTQRSPNTSRRTKPVTKKPRSSQAACGHISPYDPYTDFLQATTMSMSAACATNAHAERSTLRQYCDFVNTTCLGAPAPCRPFLPHAAASKRGRQRSPRAHKHRHARRVHLPNAGISRCESLIRNP